MQDKIETIETFVVHMSTTTHAVDYVVSKILCTMWKYRRFALYSFQLTLISENTAG